MGNILFNSPWANPADSRLKPAAFEGAYLNYTSPSKWTVEGADMLAYENRTSSAFSQQTLLTSFPAGNNGMASNIFVNNGGVGIKTNGFAMGKLGYGDPTKPGFSADGYFYGVSDLNNMWWFDGKYLLNQHEVQPWIALQGGWNHKRRAILHRQDRQPSLRRAAWRQYPEELSGIGRLQRDSVEDRYRLSAQERNLQQLQLSDHRQRRDARVLLAAQCRAVL